MGCDRGKKKNWPFKPLKKSLRADGRLQLIHTDACGPTPVKYLGNATYFLMFVDDYTRMTFVYFLKHKSDANRCVRDFIPKRRETDWEKAKQLRSDNENEYGAMALRNFLQQRRVFFEKTIPYASQQNGVAEWTKRVLMDRARAMMQWMTVLTRFQADALASAVHLRHVKLSSITN